MPDREEDTTLLSKSEIHRALRTDAGRAHYLFIVQGPGKGRRIPLGANPIVLGRAEPAEVVLPDKRVSRAHCRVCVALNEVIVVDLESSNGTFINGERIRGGAPLPVGARLQLGEHVLEHEFRDRREIEESQELDRDIEQASRYVQSLLPAPLTAGPIRTDWVLEPSARLGGDAFGYRYVDPTHFAMYLIDVSGHGAGAAMHAVSVINTLRQSALPDADLRNPASTLLALNRMFRMETHGQMYLTIWYGVYDTEARWLSYASAGHHPAYLVGAGRDRAQPLKTKNPIIGAAERPRFSSDAVAVPTGSRLYLFSDGVFEITLKDGSIWDLESFVQVMLAPPQAGIGESQRLLRAVRERASDPALEDDFTMVTFSFLARDDATRPADATWPDRTNI